MPKGTDILIDPATGDLQVETRRDALGLIAQGLAIGAVTWQNQAILLQASPGEFKEYPALGAGIAGMVNDHEWTAWEREIALQLEADGMRVNSVEIDTTSNKLIIDAQYNS